MAATPSVRVVLATPLLNRLPVLAQVLGAAGDMVFRELSDLPANLGKKVAALRPDVVVCYCPALEDGMVRAMGVMLDQSACHILVLSPRPVARDPRLDPRRVSVLVMALAGDGPRAVAQCHDVLANVRTVESRKSRSGVAGVAGARGDALIDQSFVLPESVVNRYIIAIGSSTGGTEALAALFRRLPPRMPGIVVVQHMPPVFTKMYADRLNGELPFKVTEAAQGDVISPGTVCIAPGSNHMTIKKQGNGWRVEIGDDQKVGGHCPAVDVLFESVAAEAGPLAVGIILTGMGADGAKGLLSMRRRGAFTIGQDEASCVVYGMPKKAYDFGAVVRQAALNEIPRTLLSHLARLK